MEINSVFTVTEFPKGKMPMRSEVIVRGAGQETIRHLRSQLHKFSRIVLDGFEVDGNFIPLKLNYYR
jgi:hypothetical protein